MGDVAVAAAVAGIEAACPEAACFLAFPLVVPVVVAAAAIVAVVLAPQPL